jgi:hypothetical protein
MDLQTEKLRLIEWVLKLQDVELVRRLLEIKQAGEAAETAAYEASLKPMKVEELLARAEESNRAIEAGDHVDIEDALSDLED